MLENLGLYGTNYKVYVMLFWRFYGVFTPLKSAYKILWYTVLQFISLPINLPQIYLNKQHESLKISLILI